MTELDALDGRRLIFDISTLARSRGQTDGIARVVRELAAWTHAHRRDVIYAVYDPDTEAMRRLEGAWIEPVIRGEASVDTSTLGAVHRSKRKLRDRLPHSLKAIVLWLHNPLRRLLVALERRRLTAGQELAQRIERFQARLFLRKYGSELIDRQGRRRAVVPFDMAVGPKIDLGPADVLLLAGSAWGEIETERLAELKRHGQFKIAVLCHDIIPIIYPQFFLKHQSENIRRFFHAVFPLADVTIFTSRRVESDAINYCRSAGLQLGKTGIFQPGADLVRVGGRASQLPAGLEPGRYALFVSTIEPRKGHRLVFSVWQRLLAEGVPQARHFKLVFVGRRGWLVDDLLADLDAHPTVGDTLLVFSGVDDDVLAALYRQAAFCLLPSLYEGYGLPIVEGFSYGKAVLASTGGALPEVVGDLSPCLDPGDERVWYDMMKRWIEDPAERAPFETAIRERFRHPTWQQAAQMFFQIMDDALGQV